MERLIDSKPFALFGYSGSLSALDGVTFKEKAHAMHGATAGPYNAILTDFLRAGSTCGLGFDLIVGSVSLSFAVWIRTSAISTTIVNGFATIREFVNTTVSRSTHSRVNWKKNS